MMERRPHFLTGLMVVALSAVTAGACGTPTAPVDSSVGVPASLLLTFGPPSLYPPRSLNMVAPNDPGPTMQLRTEVRDTFGALVPSARATLTSRDTAALKLDSTDFLIPYKPGITYVVATLVTARGVQIADSIPVSMVCQAFALSALGIAVQDSVTGQYGPFQGLAVTARSGAYVDSSRFSSLPAAGSPTFLPLALEFAGTLDVLVRATGYRPWTRTVTVTRGVCHVRPVSLTARLVAL